VYSAAPNPAKTGAQRIVTADIGRIGFEGPDSTNPLAVRQNDPEERVLGKRIEDRLRFAAVYGDSFRRSGGQFFERPWFSQDMVAAIAPMRTFRRGLRLKG